MRRHLKLSAVLLLAACSPMGPGEEDGGAAPVVDAGTRDAGQVIDAGTQFDAGVEVDAGVAIDAGVVVDAGVEVDAGVDAGIEFDAGVPDAGPSGPVNGCLNGDCSSNVLVIGERGTTHFGVFTQNSDVRNRPSAPTSTNTETCRVSGPFPVRTHYAFIEVRNAEATPAKVDLRVDTPPGGTFAFSYLASYAAVPTTDTQADMCLTGVNGRCADSTGLSEPRWPCLINTYAPTVPANGSIQVYFGLNTTPAAGAVPISFELRATNVTP